MHPYNGNAVIFFTVRNASVDCTRTTPDSWVRMSVWMRSKSAASAKLSQDRGAGPGRLATHA